MKRPIAVTTIAGRVATWIAGGALVLLAATPTAALAGDYHIDFCKIWNSDEPGAQLAFTHNYRGVINNCHEGGPDGGLHALLTGGVMAFDANNEIALHVPADRPGISIKRAWTRYAVPANDGSLAFVRLWANGSLLDDRVAPQTRSDDRLLPLGTRDLVWGMFCSTSASTNCYFPASDDIFHVYKARLFLTEAVDPAVEIKGGSLLGSSAKAGPRTLEVDAHDTDSGVAQVTARLAGTVVADVQYSCPPDDWSPCRRDRTGQVIDMDTTMVADGTYALSVTARDAAGNATRKELGDVAIVNTPPPAVTARDRPPVVVVVPGAPGSPVVIRESALDSAARARALIRLGRSRLTVASGRPAIIRGRLVNDDDRPISGATIHVDERTYIPKTGLIGPTWARLGDVVSDGSGTFAAKIPPGPSRALRFSYEPAGVADAAEARLSVRAGVRVRASRRTVRNGSAVGFTGRIAGAIPPAGVLVTLQAFVPHRGWIPADSRPKVGRADANGRFRVSYRFRNTLRRTRYLFRVLVNEDSAFAYSRAASRSVAVTVLPSRRSHR